MIPDADSKPESHQEKADEMMRLVEIELAQKRVAWQSACARSRKIRTASYFFLFVVVMGALFAVYIFMTQVNERRPSRPAPAASASP